FLRPRRSGARNPRAASWLHRDDAPQRAPLQGADALRRSRRCRLGRSAGMKISRVELFVLKSPGLYNNPEAAEEPLGPTYMGVVKVTTDSGICGYSDMETCASVDKACVDAPRWRQAEGVE